MAARVRRSPSLPGRCAPCAPTRSRATASARAREDGAPNRPRPVPEVRSRHRLPQADCSARSCLSDTPYCFSYTLRNFDGFLCGSTKSPVCVMVLPSLLSTSLEVPTTLPSRVIVCSRVIASTTLIVAVMPAGGPPSRYLTTPPLTETVERSVNELPSASV